MEYSAVFLGYKIYSLHFKQNRYAFHLLYAYPSSHTLISKLGLELYTGLTIYTMNKANGSHIAYWRDPTANL